MLTSLDRNFRPTRNKMLDRARLFLPKIQKKRPNPKIVHEKLGLTRPDHISGRAWIKESDLVAGSGRVRAEENTELFFDSAPDQVCIVSRGPSEKHLASLTKV